MRLVLAPAALAELHDAAAFYTQKGNVDLGLAFVAEFERTANLLLVEPKMGAIYHGTRRRYLLRRFPYSIIYQIAADELRVVAVAHHRRRPGYWSARKAIPTCAATARKQMRAVDGAGRCGRRSRRVHGGDSTCWADRHPGRGRSGGQTSRAMPRHRRRSAPEAAAPTAAATAPPAAATPPLCVPPGATAFRPGR